eukprot:160172-Chlamydomonas_euryale.AAC.1
MWSSTKQPINPTPHTLHLTLVSTAGAPGFHVGHRGAAPGRARQPQHRDGNDSDFVRGHPGHARAPAHRAEQVRCTKVFLRISEFSATEFSASQSMCCAASRPCTGALHHVHCIPLWGLCGVRLPHQRGPQKRSAHSAPRNLWSGPPKKNAHSEPCDRWAAPPPPKKGSVVVVRFGAHTLSRCVIHTHTLSRRGANPPTSGRARGGGGAGEEQTAPRQLSMPVLYPPLILTPTPTLSSTHVGWPDHAHRRLHTFHLHTDAPTPRRIHTRRPADSTSPPAPHARPPHPLLPHLQAGRPDRAHRWFDCDADVRSGAPRERLTAASVCPAQLFVAFPRRPRVRRPGAFCKRVAVCGAHGDRGRRADRHVRGRPRCVARGASGVDGVDEG